ncbi:thioredoxin family protein [Mycobacterium sp.]|uniref:thioredoxin family protein n=1 Tax=Mycobacterium sp. TaxID=1785 RepID=UPI003C745CB9
MGKVDVDKAPASAPRFTVRAVPTLLLIDEGQVWARQSGAASVASLRNWLDKSLGEHTGQEAFS